MKLKQVSSIVYTTEAYSASFEKLRKKKTCISEKQIKTIHKILPCIHFYFQKKKNHWLRQVGHCFLDICQQSQQLSLSLCCFISPLRTFVHWHSSRKTHIHLTVSTFLGIEVILCLLDVCKALEIPVSTGRSLRHNIQHSV